MSNSSLHPALLARSYCAADAEAGSTPLSASCRICAPLPRTAASSPSLSPPGFVTTAAQHARAAHSCPTLRCAPRLPATFALNSSTRAGKSVRNALCRDRRRHAQAPTDCRGRGLCGSWRRRRRRGRQLRAASCISDRCGTIINRELRVAAHACVKQEPLPTAVPRGQNCMNA